MGGGPAADESQRLLRGAGVESVAALFEHLPTTPPDLLDLPQTHADDRLGSLHELGRWLAALGGIDRVALQPVGPEEATTVMLRVVKAYQTHRGEARDVVIAASTLREDPEPIAARLGLQVERLPARADGLLDPKDLAAVLSRRVCALWIPHPNALGLEGFGCGTALARQEFE